MSPFPTSLASEKRSGPGSACGEFSNLRDTLRPGQVSAREAEMKTEWVVITPEMAAKFLEKNKNRNMRENYARRLAADMREGRWRKTHQGIAFNCDGTLRDGQHRLRAIVLADVPIEMMVSSGLTDDAMLHVDGGAPRCDADRMKLSGAEYASRNLIAVARRMKSSVMLDHGGSEFRTTKIFEFVEQHKEAILFAIALFSSKSKGLSSAAVVAPLARAWYTRDRDRLAKFAEVMRADFVHSEEDSAAQKLKAYLLTNSNGGTGHMGRASIYRKVESALLAFLERRPLAKLYEVSAEQFPIPGEDQSVSS